MNIKNKRERRSFLDEYNSIPDELKKDINRNNSKNDDIRLYYYDLTKLKNIKNIRNIT
jgi:hypothetical protein